MLLGGWLHVSHSRCRVSDVFHRLTEDVGAADKHGSVLLRSCYKYVTINTLNTRHRSTLRDALCFYVFIFECSVDLLDVQHPKEMNKEQN